MKNYKTIIAAVVAGLACTAATSKAGVVSNFGDSNPALSGGGISFAGNSTFSLGNETAGGQFTGSFGADAYTGTISGSPWTYGSITVNGTQQSALVTSGAGTILTITTASGTLTGTLTWGLIDSDGTGGGINLLSTFVNVTGITTTGTDAAITAFLDGSTMGILNLSTAFSSTDTLTSLATGTTLSNQGFTGTFQTVLPEPSTYVAGALMLLPFGVGALRSLRKDRVA